MKITHTSGKRKRSIARATLKEGQGIIKINNKPYSLKEGSLKRWQNKKWGELNIKWYKIMPKLAPWR